MDYYAYFASPLGRMLLTASESALTGVHFVGEKYYPGVSARADEDASQTVLGGAIAQLAEYFAGERRRFELPLAPQGTAFQRRIWRALVEVPFGATLSYGELALRAGVPEAARAVGAANGRNPISIVIPCHRIVGSDGSLTGYAGGIERKRALLALESGGVRQFDLFSERPGEYAL